MTRPSSCEHVVVYRDPAYFAGWPFNGGFWQFEDGELVVGFIRGKCDYQSHQCVWHNKIDNEAGEHVFLRSTDGGRTWPLASMTTAYTRPAFDQQVNAHKPAAQKTTPLNPRHEDYCLIAGFGIPEKTQAHKAFTLISQDRGRTWGHLALLPYGKNSAPLFTFVAARPTYIVRPDGMLLLFGMVDCTGFETNQTRPFVFASTDGGLSWLPLAEVTMEPAFPMGIMGFPLQCEDGTILLAVRRQYTMGGAFTQIYASTDGAHSWQLRSRVNDFGAPADLNFLPDGSIVCTYGYRVEPFGIRARISRDQGRTWGAEIILRDDGGSNDLGYPRTIVRADGSLVTTYYFNMLDDPVQYFGGVRHIAATLWRP